VHELSYAQALVENLLPIIEKNGAKKVSKVVVEVGELLLINPEQLKFCYEALTKDTILEGSELEVVKVEPKLVCESCGKNYTGLMRFCECRDILNVERGDEFVLKKVVLEVEDAQNRN